MTKPKRRSFVLLDGLGKCERACLLVLELANREGKRVDAARIAYLTGYTVAEVEVGIEALIGRGLAQRPTQGIGTGHA